VDAQSLDVQTEKSSRYRRKEVMELSLTPAFVAALTTRIDEWSKIMRIRPKGEALEDILVAAFDTLGEVEHIEWKGFGHGRHDITPRFSDGTVTNYGVKTGVLHHYKKKNITTLKWSGSRTSKFGTVEERIAFLADSTEAGIIFMPTLESVSTLVSTPTYRVILAPPTHELIPFEELIHTGEIQTGRTGREKFVAETDLYRVETFVDAGEQWWFQIPWNFLKDRCEYADITVSTEYEALVPEVSTVDVSISRRNLEAYQLKLEYRDRWRNFFEYQS
jgi:hypothetical protein